MRKCSDRATAARTTRISDGDEATACTVATPLNDTRKTERGDK